MKQDPAYTSFGNLFPEITYDTDKGGQSSLDIWNAYRIQVDASSEEVAYFYHPVAPHDTLDSISHTYYATSKLWWIIALANDIQDPFDFLDDVRDGTEGVNGKIKVYKKIAIDSILYNLKRTKLTKEL
jgi:hypothetical protein